MTHNELVDLSHKFVLKNMSCGFCCKEIKTTEREIEDLPNNWGLIYCENNKLKIVHNPYCKSLKGNIYTEGFIYNKDAERAIMYSALRRQK